MDVEDIKKQKIKKKQKKRKYGRFDHKHPVTVSWWLDEVNLKGENRITNKNIDKWEEVYCIEYLEMASWGQCWASGRHNGYKTTAGCCGHACPGLCRGTYEAGSLWMP